MSEKRIEKLINNCIDTAVTDTINEILDYIEDQYQKKKLSASCYADVLLLITEVLPHVENREKWTNIGYNICWSEKQILENYGIQNIDMFQGFGYRCFAINQFCDQAKILKGFSLSLNKLFFSSVHGKINKINDDDKHDSDYDLISGVSGLLYYLLDCEQIDENILIECVQYLVKLSDDVDYCGIDVIKFHILQKNQNVIFNERAPKGSINFGLAHGILGPLLALAKAYSKGYIVDGQKNAIEKIYNLYETFKIVDNENISVWPEIITPEEYLEGKCRKELLYSRSSWCYGNAGILRGLQKVAKYMKWEEIEKSYEDNLISFFNQNTETYNLSSPSICHGYSSILAIQTSAYYHTNDLRMLNNIERNVSLIISTYDDNSKKPFNKENKLEGCIEDISLLTGSVGVAISLLSLKGNIKTGKLLMID